MKENLKLKSKKNNLKMANINGYLEENAFILGKIKVLSLAIAKQAVTSAKTKWVSSTHLPNDARDVIVATDGETNEASYNDENNLWRWTTGATIDPEFILGWCEMPKYEKP